MTLALRPYQVRAVDALRGSTRASADGTRKGALAVMCVGAGKTLTALSRAVEVLDDAGRVCWIAHREELISQPLNDLAKHWFRHYNSAGIVKAQRNAVDKRMVFASIATLAKPKRLAELLQHGAFDLVILDEAHHDTTPSYRAVLKGLAGPTTQFVGLTATPDREDGGPIGDFWEIVYSYDLLDAIPAGWLVEPHVYRYRMPELDAVLAASGGRLDHDDEVQGQQLLRSHVVEHTVRVCTEVCTAQRLPWRDATREFDPRKLQGLVFTATIEQARLTAAALSRAGIKSRAVSGNPKHTPPEERALILRAYRRGEIQVLCNANLLTEGTDLPCTGFVVYARACRSRPLFVQILGRGARLYDPNWKQEWGLCNRLDPRYTGKQAELVIDLTGCTEEHSIIAAPVLLTGACDHRADAGFAPETDRSDPDLDYVPHTAWERYDGHKARCASCDATKPCFRSLVNGGDGQHAIPPKGKPACKHCGREQCPSSPKVNEQGETLASAGRHVWRGPDGDHKFNCLYCTVEYTDPLASVYSGPRDHLADDRRFLDGDESDDNGDDIREYGLVNLHELARFDGSAPVHETWAVDLEAHGLLFLDGDRRGTGTWSVWWLAANAPAPRQIGERYDTRRGWAVARDLIRQMAKRRPEARAGRETREAWGGHADEASREALRQRATAIATQLGVARAA